MIRETRLCTCCTPSPESGMHMRGGGENEREMEGSGISRGWEGEKIGRGRVGGRGKSYKHVYGWVWGAKMQNNKGREKEERNDMYIYMYICTSDFL